MSVTKSRQKKDPDWIPSIDLILDHDADLPLKRLVEITNLDSDTIELLLRLGTSLREKGEVERAIHLHQTLFARTDLARSTLQQIELELARDYAHAGLHDRAERLLKNLIVTRSSRQEAAALALVDLY
ncbi:MAG: hypothetical protein ACPGYX_07360 [Oceanobacter sp.]